MSLGAYHIAITRYNRSMQNTPKKRFAYRDKVWLDYLKGKIQYGGKIIDRKTSSERRNVRRRLQSALQRDRIIAFMAVIIFIVTTCGLIMTLF